jgi:hypothetical protein
MSGGGGSVAAWGCLGASARKHALRSRVVSLMVPHRPVEVD